MDQFQFQTYETGSDTVADHLIYSQSYPSNLKCFSELFLTVCDDFCDPDFPPQPQSISQNYTQSKKAQTSRWLRVKDIYPTDKIAVFKGGIDPTDIKQGELSDCYFLSTLSALAEQPNQLIHKLFITKEPSKYGIYGVWLCYEGEWRQVFVDDFIPCALKSKTPKFTKAVDGELWVLILEKAYSKIFGNYEKIEFGFSAQAFRDLTGANAVNYSRKDESPAEGTKFFKIMEENLQKNYMITAASEQSSQGVEQQSSLGMVSSHCYAILAVHRIQDSNGQEIELIKIRNPWGRKEWLGDWSDKSSKWTPELREQLQVVDADDGIFWMNSQDFIKEFAMMTVGYLNPKYFYSSYRFQNLSINDNESTCVAQIKNQHNQNHHFITISQMDRRSSQGDGKSFKYNLVKLIIMKINENGEPIQYITSKCEASRDVFMECDLDEGTYEVFVDVFWEQNYNRSLVASTYSSQPVQILHSERSQGKNHTQYIKKKKKEQIHTFLEESLKIHSIQGQNVKVQEFKPQVKRFNCFIGGYLYFYYQNNSPKLYLKEEIQMKNYKNIAVCQPYKETDKNTIEVVPGTSKIILYKIIKDGAYSYSFQSSYTLRT